MICRFQLCRDLVGSILPQQGDVKELIPLPVCVCVSHPFLFSSPPPDDRSSAASGLDVADRLTYLEQRMQMQEDEIQLLKMALADVLKRLNISEEHQAAAAAAAAAGGRKPLGAKGELGICVQHFFILFPTQSVDLCNGLLMELNVHQCSGAATELCFCIFMFL